MATQVKEAEIDLVTKIPKVYNNIFAIGDTTLTSENEEKSVTPINM
jgi:NADH dehydrogenase FAD-containing subunit